MEAQSLEPNLLVEEFLDVDYDAVAGAVDESWMSRRMTHSQLVETARGAVGGGASSSSSKRVSRAVGMVPTPAQGSTSVPWPRRTMEQGAPAPPVITSEMVEAIEAEDAVGNPDSPPGPAASAFIRQLSAWKDRLSTFFGLSSTCLASNLRSAAHRIRARILFLPRERVERVMNIIQNGYLIPLLSAPPPFHRSHNSPDLSEHKIAAWQALRKDIGHGAVLPCDLPRQGKPSIVSPVRTAPKGWRTGKRRFVVNLRYLNRFIPDEDCTCDLETLAKVRNLFEYSPEVASRTWFFSMDLSSGYHNFWIHPSQWHLLGIALHVSELPPEAVTYLREHFPNCEDRASGNFYFLMRALPFGLGPSCAVFSDVITALAAAWRRHEVCRRPVRLTSYIDDFLPMAHSVRASLILIIELVYEATATGLTLQVEKCRLFPATRIKYVHVLVRTSHFVPRVLPVANSHPH